ncbi:hypothetical protein M9H77_22303 [Catharanthus roseus]|uniref:Uncharacterized protein n=1 Tax=Catharanthus roseus TaxID=4058 RepID=A0ACC0AQ40_CATRO|nr:hypothetical protein M9H77_22303 [Catharanthus roseus]
MNSYREMIIDASSPNFISHEETNHQEPPNPMAKKFFNMLKAIETSLVEGDDRYLVLSACVELLYIKYENQWTQKSYDDSCLSKKLDIAFETYFEEIKNDETEIEWDSDKEDYDEDSNEETNVASNNDSNEDSDI